MPLASGALAAAAFTSGAAGGPAAGVALPGMVYNGAPMSAALAFRPVGGVAVHGVANAAAARFLPHQSEAGFAVRAVDDQAHRDALDPARGIERHQPDVVLREGAAAVVQFQHHPGRVL